MSSDTTRRSQATPLKDAIESFLRTYDLKTKFNETYLIAFLGKNDGFDYCFSNQRDLCKKSNIIPQNRIFAASSGAFHGKNQIN